MKRVLITVLMIFIVAGLFGCGGDKTIVIADKGLEGAIREKINKPIGDITIKDMEQLESLNADARKIENLSGLEHAVNLKELYAPLNNISDLSPLSKLKKLEWLDIAHNQVSDITPLAKLEKIYYFYAGVNEIEDISTLRKLKNISRLDLAQNNINDASPLMEIPKLKSVDVEYNNLDLNDNKTNNVITTLLQAGVEIRYKEQGNVLK